MNITREFYPTDRYIYDFHKCTSRDGWAQIDTSEDAHYYGNWANPLLLEIVTYIEGDVTTYKADTVKEFVEEMRRLQKFHEENKSPCKIDGMGKDVIINKFKDMGLGDMLHKSHMTSNS